MRAALQVNWRNKASYGYAAKLTGLGWAWEFLRRNPRFREECAQSQARPTTGGKVPRAIFPPSKWGVLRADSLDQTATGANVFWDPAVCRHVLPVLSATPSIAVQPANSGSVAWYCATTRPGCPARSGTTTSPPSRPMARSCWSAPSARSKGRCAGGSRPVPAPRCLRETRRRSARGRTEPRRARASTSNPA